MKFTQTLIATLATAQPLDVPQRRSSQEVAQPVDASTLNAHSKLFLDQAEAFIGSGQTIDQADFSALDNLPDAYLGDLALRMEQLGHELDVEERTLKFEQDLNEIDPDIEISDSFETEAYLDVLDGMDEEELQLMMNKLNESIEQFVGMPLSELDQLPEEEFQNYMSQF